VRVLEPASMQLQICILAQITADELSFCDASAKIKNYIHAVLNRTDFKQHIPGSWHPHVYVAGGGGGARFGWPGLRRFKFSKFCHY